MSQVYSRAALLTGASLSALSLASPALAATTTRPGIEDVIVGSSITDTLQICNIGSPPPTPCVYGVVADGSGDVTATVTSTAAGQILQSALATSGDIALTLNNDGIAIVTAFADAHSGTGPQTADAFIDGGVVQFGQGTGEVGLGFTNDGALAIHAAASASAGSAAAAANAAIDAGVNQLAVGTGVNPASVTLTNNGEIDVVASAHAVGGGIPAVTSSGALVPDALASAAVHSGIRAFAEAGTGGAQVALDNQGKLVIGARATASASTGTAFAHAIVASGIAEGAFEAGSGNVSVELENAGLIEIGAAASANAPLATAVATIVAGIHQSAIAEGNGGALASIDNVGTIEIAASAQAHGNTALAVAIESSAIAGHASGTGNSLGGAEAGVKFINDGSVSIQGLADASAASGSAIALAHGRDVLVERAIAVDGVASASFSNLGSINITEAARAHGSGPAAAVVVLQSGLLDAARGLDADASGVFNNNGAITIAAVAQATGSGFTTGTGTSPVAHPVLATVIDSRALQEEITTLGGGNAAARFDNSGSISIEASAIASGNGSGAPVVANAQLFAALLDVASAFVFTSTAASHTANAQATLINSGSITLAAQARAVASAGTALADATVINAFAAAASAANGNVDVAFTNSGTLAVVATADAKVSAASTPSTRPANAVAAAGGNFFGGGEFGQARTGSASVTMQNDGVILIAAMAHASAPSGHAAAFDGLVEAFQQLSGGARGATIGLTNSGTFEIVLGPQATGTSALAQGILNGGFVQTAHALDGDATAVLDNEGTFDIDVTAIANASVFNATARALADFGVEQIALARSGDASATYVNNGDINVLEHASANAAGHASALAIDFAQLLQQAVTVGGGKDVASFTNTGHIDQAAIATAAGASASAFAEEALAVSQNAHANRGFGSTITASGTIFSTTPAGDTFANLTNSGTIMIAALAKADASSGFARAVASGSQVVVQQALTPDGDASAKFTNSGTIAIVNSAVAVGASALANATLVTAVAQAVVASGGEAHASFTNDGSISVAAIAKASADAIGSAQALIGGAIIQLGQSKDGTTLALSNTGSVNIVADGVASGSETAVGAAIAVGIAQQAHGTLSFTSSSSSFSERGRTVSGPASIAFDNQGTITIMAEGAGTADLNAEGVVLATGIVQNALGSPAAVSLTNGGKIDVIGMASGTAAHSAIASAQVLGIEQSAFATNSDSVSTFGTGSSVGHHVTFTVSGAASVSLTNSGSVSVLALAHASQTGATGTGDAHASISAGLKQLAVGATATDSFVNKGTFAAVAMASASAVDLASAQASVKGVQQHARGTGISITAVTTPSATNSFHVSSSVDGAASASLDNEGVISVAAIANATGRIGSVAAAAIGASQLAAGTSAAATIINGGTFEVDAVAQATGSSRAIGQASALGATQAAVGTADASIALTNTGLFKVMAELDLKGGSDARGFASATGVAQHVELAAGTAAVANGGTIAVAAVVSASASTHVDARAFAQGIAQTDFLGDFTAALDNEGKLNVVAEVTDQVGAGGSALAAATAIGFQASGNHVGASITNAGTFNAIAAVDAVAAAGSARAHAIGLEITANSTNVAAPGIIDGTITNSGTIGVLASVAGAGTVPALTGTGAVALSHASATGIRLSSNANGATVSNSGLIMVEAVAASGGDTKATGILATGTSSGSSSVLTIDNKGEIIARVSSDGGATWRRGTAIDVAGAPGASVVNLLGGGMIYGDIALKDGDAINVKDGTTIFYGIINPALSGGPGGVGSLNIASGGNLLLADPRIVGPAKSYDGPSFVHVDTLDVAAGGKLTYDLEPASGGVQAPGSYVQVFANQATLAGALIANVTTANGLFADSYSWDNVVEAGAISGKFSACSLGGVDAGSVLLSLTCSYDATSVDLKLSRVAFDKVGGLNQNGIATGTGLESLYKPTLTGGVAKLFADLFKIDSGAGYNLALNDLSGSVYANYLQSFGSLGVRYDRLIAKGSECERPNLGGSSLECRDGAPFHVWGQLDFEHRSTDADNEAGSTSAGRLSTLLGVDAAVAPETVVGGTVGYVTNHVRDHQFGDTADGEGTIVGGYAVFDPGAFFVKGIASYSWFNGKANRHIDFSLADPAATFVGHPSGNPDARLFTAGLHSGVRLATGASSVATPYLDLDYVHAKLDGFSEDGSSGAELRIRGGTSEHLYATAGLKWATQLGGITPEIGFGYRYRFGDPRSSVDEAFLAGGNDFTIVSASQKRSSYLGSFSLGGKVGRFNLDVSYEGEFNGDVTSHSGNIKITLPLGGHEAPPPPPPVTAPPPAPAPEAAPPPPPPPPPPPVERGERGQ